MNVKEFICAPLSWPLGSPELLAVKREDSNINGFLPNPKRVIKFSEPARKNPRFKVNFEILQLDSKTRANWENAGNEFFELDNLVPADFKNLYEDSYALISYSMELQKTVKSFSKKIVLLKSDVDFDVSFSDPSLNDTVFISTSEKFREK